MKKWFYSLMTLAAALTVTSCLKDIEGGAAYGDGDYVDASFAVTLGPQTKAFADGTKVNTLWAGLYETDDATNPTTFKWVADNFTPSPPQPIAITADGATAQFPGKVQLGKTYRVVFFAVYESDATPGDDPLIGYQWHNTDNDLTGPTISYVDYAADSNLANDDKRDAFYGYYDTGAVTGNINVTTPIQLRRPFSQINVLVPTGNVPAGTITSSMTVANAPTELNLATKATSNPQNWSFTANTIGETAFGGYANSHKYVAMNYVLVNQDATADTRYNVGFTVDAGDATSGPKSIANVPLKPNGRTNIVGNVFAEDFNITVPIIIDPVTQTDQVLTTVTVTVGQTAADAVLLNGPTNINVGVSHKITEEADLPSFSYDPAGVAVAQWVVDDATAGTGHIKVTPLVTNGSTKITAIFPAVTKTDYSAASAVFYVKMGNGENDKILQDVEITTAPTKLTFAVGDKFAFDGAVTATFTNPAGTEVIPVANLVFTDTEVTPNTYVPGETVLNTAGTYNIVVTYTYNGKSLSDMILPGDEPYEITVTDGPALIDRELVFKLDQTAVTEATVTFGADDNIFPTLSGKKIDDVTYSLENVSPAGCVTINESTGAVTLVGAGSATVKATASATTEYQAGVASYALTVNAAPAPTYDFTTIAALNALVTTTETEYSGYLTNAVLSFIPATNTAIIKDATGSITYFKKDHGLKQGQTFTGAITVKALLFNGYSEITSIGDASFTGSQATVNPESVALASLIGHFSDYQNAYVTVSGLTVTAVSGKTISVSNGTNEYQVYCQFGNATCGVNDVITATGTITKYNNKEQVKVWTADGLTVTSSSPKAITFSQPTQTGCSIAVSVGGNAITSGTTVASGTTVTLTATVGSNYNFGGWTVNGATVASATATTTSFEMGTSAVSISATFTSKSASTTYTKVTSAPTDWSGTYLIVYEESQLVCLVGTDGYHNYTTASISSGVISSDDLSNYEVQIESYSTGYSIKALGGEKANKYIEGKGADTNGTSFVESPSNVTTLALSDGLVTITNNTDLFVYNATSGTNGERWRFYKAATAAGDVYKKPALYKKN